MASVKPNRKSITRPKRFVICLSSGKTPAALEPRKVYWNLRDAAAEAHGMLRVVDESGEDYLHPAHLFGRITLPIETRLALERARLDAG